MLSCNANKSGQSFFTTDIIVRHVIPVITEKVSMNLSTPDSNSEGNLYRHSHRWLEFCTAFWLLCLLLSGILVNGLALYIFLRTRVLSASNNVLVAALLVNNLGLAVFGFPLAIIAEVSGGWSIHLNMTACIYNAFVVYFFALSSMYLLMAISITRYLIITHTATFSKKITVKVTMCVVAFCYSSSLGMTMAPLFGLGSYGLEEHRTSCGLAWDDRSAGSKTYLLVILFANFVVPLLIMTYCYAVIYYTVRSTISRRDSIAAKKPM